MSYYIKNADGSRTLIANVGSGGGGGGSVDQVQADWNTTNTDHPSYIKNKPFTTPETAPFVLKAGDTVTGSIISNVLNFTNDKEFITKKYVDDLIAGVVSLDIRVVTTLPTTDISSTTIYLVPKTASTNNIYDEYIYVNSSWELIGSTEVDLSDYYTKDEVDDAIGAIPEQVQANWNETATTSKAYIQNKPDLTQFITEDDLEPYAKTADIPAQVQADWNETNVTSKAYIQNKPDLSDYVTDTEIPTLLGDYLPLAGGNMEGHITTDMTSFTADSQLVNKKYVDDTVAAAGATEYRVVSALPAIGENGVVYLVPIDPSDSTKGYHQWVYSNNFWIDLGTTTVNLEDYYTKTQADSRFLNLDGGTLSGQVTTNQTSFTADQQLITKKYVDDSISGIDLSEFITADDVPAAQAQSDWSETDNTDPAFIKNKPTIYTKSEVDDLIAGISGLDYQVVATLPTTDISTTTIYLVLDSTASAGNVYNEYLRINDAWELIGTTAIDLSNYLPISGGTMTSGITGAIEVEIQPTGLTGVASTSGTKPTITGFDITGYAPTSALGNYVEKTGDTMSGTLNVTDGETGSGTAKIQANGLITTDVAVTAGTYSGSTLTGSSLTQTGFSVSNNLGTAYVNPQVLSIADANNNSISITEAGGINIDTTKTGGSGINFSVNPGQITYSNNNGISIQRGPALDRYQYTYTGSGSKSWVLNSSLSTNASSGFQVYHKAVDGSALDYAFTANVDEFSYESNGEINKLFAVSDDDTTLEYTTGETGEYRRLQVLKESSSSLTDYGFTLNGVGHGNSITASWYLNANGVQGYRGDGSYWSIDGAATTSGSTSNSRLYLQSSNNIQTYLQTAISTNNPILYYSGLNRMVNITPETFRGTHPSGSDFYVTWGSTDPEIRLLGATVTGSSNDGTASIKPGVISLSGHPGAGSSALVDFIENTLTITFSTGSEQDIRYAHGAASTTVWTDNRRTIAASGSEGYGGWLFINTITYNGDTDPTVHNVNIFRGRVTVSETTPVLDSELTSKFYVDNVTGGIANTITNNAGNTGAALALSVNNTSKNVVAELPAPQDWDTAAKSATTMAPTVSQQDGLLLTYQQNDTVATTILPSIYASPFGLEGNSGSAGIGLSTIIPYLKNFDLVVKADKMALTDYTTTDEYVDAIDVLVTYINALKAQIDSLVDANNTGF